MLRFTLRDMFFVTLTIALITGWWLDHRLQERRHAQEKEAVLQEAADMLHEATNDFGP